jgi:4-aminobutyrate aminotransferase
MPIGLVVARKPIMENWPRGAHGNTFGGNPLCCAAALASLDLIEKHYMANAAETGAYFIDRLRELQGRHPEIGDVRGRGLFIGMELVTDRVTKLPAKELCEAVITRAFYNGLILLMCGTSTVRFMPPLVVTGAEVDEALAILDASITEARSICRQRPGV